MASELETRVLRKITYRIVPFIMLLYFVAFIDRVYDAQLPIRATGETLDLVFPEEMLAGGYRKKYLRAISRLVASTLD